MTKSIVRMPLKMKTNKIITLPCFCLCIFRLNHSVPSLITGCVLDWSGLCWLLQVNLHRLGGSSPQGEETGLSGGSHPITGVWGGSLSLPGSLTSEGVQTLARESLEYDLTWLVSFLRILEAYLQSPPVPGSKGLTTRPKIFPQTSQYLSSGASTQVAFWDYLSST